MLCVKTKKMPDENTRTNKETVRYSRIHKKTMTKIQRKTNPFTTWMKQSPFSFKNDITSLSIDFFSSSRLSCTEGSSSHIGSDVSTDSSLSTAVPSCLMLLSLLRPASLRNASNVSFNLSDKSPEILLKSNSRVLSRASELAKTSPSAESLLLSVCCSLTWRLFWRTAFSALSRLNSAS